MRLDPIVVVDHDPSWSTWFAEQRDRIAPVLAPWLTGPIDHIGSTSVPGLPAKPIIDMLARVDDHTACHAAFPRLAELGWLAAPEPGDGAARKWSLCHPSVEYRTHHLHLVEEDSTGWPSWLAFRDHLRGCVEDRETYARIKRSLAVEDRDRTAYRSGKAPFITSVLRRLGYSAQASRCGSAL